jgi:hypothetical protein
MALRGPRSLFGLVAGWIAWWVFLAAWKIGPAVPAIYRVSRDGAHGTANIQFGDGAFSATIVEGGKVAYEGRIGFLPLVLLIALPPLLLWALWLRSPKRTDAPDLIGEGAPDPWTARAAERSKEPRQ